MSDSSTRDHDTPANAGQPDAWSGETALRKLAESPYVPGRVHWVWNIPADTVHYSREWLAILQTDDEAVLGGNTEAWWRQVHEDDVIPFLDMARDIVEGRTELYQTLLRVRRGDGAWAWLLSRGTVTQRDKGGGAVIVEGDIMDVTLLHADVKFRHGQAMLENSPDLIVRMDRELSPLRASPRVVRAISGKHLPSGADENSFPEIGPERLAFLHDNVEKVFDDGLSVRKQVTFPTAYGHDVTGEYSFWPEFDAAGNVASVMTQFRDLTEQVLVERRARLNETRLEALYRITHMGNAPEREVLRFVMDSVVRLSGSEGGCLFFPDKYPGNRGRVVWSRENTGDPDEPDLPEDAFPLDMLELVTAKDGVTPLRLLKNGNSLHPLHYVFNMRPIMRYMTVPVFDGERVVCIAAVSNKQTDYTEADQQQFEAFISGAWLVLRRHEFVRELERAKNAAEHASQVKDQFLANVSHELRTPLNGMLSMLQLLEFLPLDDQGLEYVRTASAAGQSLMRIISDILDFSRMESGMSPLRREPFDLADEVEEALTVFRRNAGDKGLSFEVAVDRTVPSPLIGDGPRLRQILFNVVGNALKFTESGGIRVEASLLPRGAPGTACVYFAVIDTGIGIPIEYQRSVFDPFIQIDSSSARKHAGTGLGLSIVRHLVSLMNGGICVESEVEKGTAMHFSLCFGMPPAVRAAPPPRKRAAAAAGGDGLDILVAEDDPTGRFALQAFLKRLGHRAMCVENGRAAIEALRLHPFHCLFTDIQMPEMDGLELVSRIRDNRTSDILPAGETRERLLEAFPEAAAAGAAVPDDLIVIAVSAHAMSGDKERFLQAGMDFYLSKPILMDELAGVLDDARARLAHRGTWKE